MITIDQLNVTVTLEAGGEPGEAAFNRLFNRSIDQWWRQVQAHVRQEAQRAADRNIVQSREGNR